MPFLSKFRKRKKKEKKESNIKKKKKEKRKEKKPSIMIIKADRIFFVVLLIFVNQKHNNAFEYFSLCCQVTNLMDSNNTRKTEYRNRKMGRYEVKWHS